MSSEFDPADGRYFDQANNQWRDIPTSTAISAKRAALALEKIAGMMEHERFQRSMEAARKSHERADADLRRASDDRFFTALKLALLLFCVCSLIGMYARDITAFINWITH